MIGKTKEVLMLLVLPCISLGLFIEENHCDVDVGPSRIGDPPIRHFEVPAKCINGTFRWAYPKKTVELHFVNPYQNEMTVCVKNGMLGDIFTVRDVTHGFGMPMVIGEKESCTMKSRETITLRIDAPDTLYYVASIIYHVHDM